MKATDPGTTSYLTISYRVRTSLASHYQKKVHRPITRGVVISHEISPPTTLTQNFTHIAAQPISLIAHNITHNARSNRQYVKTQQTAKEKQIRWR